MAWIFANKLQSSAREEYLRKQDARKLGEQRQQVGNKGNARKAGVVGKLVGGKTDLEDQILSDTSDNKGLADYGSEKNDYMKTEGSSRSQSRGKFFSYPSFTFHLKGVLQEGFPDHILECIPGYKHA